MTKVEVQPYHCSINNAGFDSDEIAMIWEFYVTKSIAKTAAQRRSVSDYALKHLPYTDMLKIAGIQEDKAKVLCANSINSTLDSLDLQITEKVGKETRSKAIDIETCRLVCITPYTIADEEPPKPQFGDAESILTHIRNSFAHGLTYFFTNGNVLFEDKDARGNITARMLIKQKTLLEWIALIDHNNLFYGNKQESNPFEKQKGA